MEKKIASYSADDIQRFWMDSNFQSPKWIVWRHFHTKLTEHQKTNCILGCNKRSLTSRWKEVILNL